MYLLESFDESREEIGGSTSHLGGPMVEAPLVHESHLKHTTDSVLIRSFNSKTLFKDGDPVSLKLMGPSKHANNTTIIQTNIQNNTGSSDKQGQTQLTLSYKNISINTHT